jgi:sugar phosphate isomerase/epimerase
LLADTDARKRFEEAIVGRGLAISALSQQGNPLHPDPATAAAAHDTWMATVRLAAALGVGVVNAFSGCPGDDGDARRPNWVTCSWPTDYADTLAWQWEERLIPYWTEQASFAADHGVTVGIEMHAGMAVYNPATLLRLRDACGTAIAANFDPSHLFWQGIDPAAAVSVLGERDAIAHVDAKDTELLADRVAVDGVLETRPAAAVDARAWRFRTIGCGHDAAEWGRIVAALRAVGYDGVVSIEHEDRLLPADEGLARAVSLLAGIV